jgi:hypothetical protein
MAISLFENTTPTSAELEAEWRANWRDQSLLIGLPYLFAEVALDTLPATLKCYVRGVVGQWSLVPDGADTVSTLDPSDGVWTGRWFIGQNSSGFVLASSEAGTATCSRSSVSG